MRSSMRHMTQFFQQTIAEREKKERKNLLSKRELRYSNFDLLTMFGTHFKQTKYYFKNQLKLVLRNYQDN